MKLSEKLILVDCDGVLLDWKYSFWKWMMARGHEPVADGEYDIAKTFWLEKLKAQGLVEHFNTSAAMGWLSPFRDAVKYVKKLHEDHGYVFHCITSLSTDYYAGKLREKNLESIFGKRVFERVVCLPCGGDKDEALAEYANTDCVWVEDKPENAVVGANLGLNAMLIHHNHNDGFEHPFVTNVANWKEIYELIV